MNFAADIPTFEFVQAPAQVPSDRAIVVTAARTIYVLNCRAKLLHAPAADEDSTERSEWQARCGWPYGVGQFFRLHDLPPSPRLCRRCFPESTVDVDAPEKVSSSSSSSSTSGATSDSD